MKIASISFWIKKYSVSLLFLLVFLSYANTLSNGFVYDDTFFSQRRELRQLSYLPNLIVESYLPNNKTAGAYRPLTVLSFSLNFILTGESPVFFHAVNIILHAGVTILLYVFLRKLEVSFFQSLLIATIFAVHPIHVEAVANIKARDELFHGLFTLIALVVSFRLIGNKKNRIVWLSIIAIIFFLGLLAKEMTITIPVATTLLLFYKKQKLKIVLLLNIFFFCFFSIYLVMRYMALDGSLLGSFYSTDFVGNKLYIASSITRLFTGFEIYWIYIRTFLMPIHLSATYGYAQLIPIEYPLIQLSWIPGAIAFFSTFLLLICAYIRKWSKVFLFTALWLFFYLPVSQMILPMGDIVAERWMYTPSIFFISILGLFLASLIRKQKKLILVFIVLILFLTTRTVIRNQVWQKNILLFKSMVDSSPRSVQAHTGYGYELLKKQDYEKAKYHAEVAYSIYPDFPQLLNLLGNISTLERKYDDAINYYNRSLQLSPNTIQTYTFLASMYYVKGDYQLALDTYQFALDKKVTFTYEDILSYAATLAKLGKYDDSIQVLSELTLIEKEREQSQFLLAVNYYKKGEKKKVLDHIRWNRALTRMEREKILEEF